MTQLHDGLMSGVVERQKRTPKPMWFDRHPWRASLLIIVLIFALVLAIRLLGCMDKAGATTPIPAPASLPAVIFSGEKPLSEWNAAYPHEAGKTWGGKMEETCFQERGILVWTEFNGRVSYTCIRRVEAPPRTSRHRA